VKGSSPVISRRQPKTVDRRLPINTVLKRRQSISTAAATSTLRYLAHDMFSFSFLPTAGNWKEKHVYRISLIFVDAAPADRHRIRDTSLAASQKST